jgi:dTMP kinase
MIGKFITFEGIEGAGKSSQIEAARDLLTAQGKHVITTREPGGTPYAEQIRELVLRPSDEAVAPMAELLLIFAARAQHLNQLITPALAAGQWVLCDRFTDASYAYQSAGRGMSWDDIASLESLVQGALRPDCVFIFDLPVAVGLARAAARNGATDRFECERAEFFERVRACYLRRAAEHPLSYNVLDASASMSAVSAQIAAMLKLIC